MVEERPRLPNKVAEFVIRHVDDYASLDAPDLASSEEVFTDVAENILKKQQVNVPKIGSGSVFSVYSLVGEKNIVLKRMRVGTPEDFAEIQEQHEQAVSYFGSEYIPHTSFVTVHGTNFGDHNMSFQQSLEFVALQESVDGVLFRGRFTDEFLLELGEVTPEMRESVDGYIERYRAMQQEDLAVPDPQLMFDKEQNRVWHFDTNLPVVFQEYVTDNSFLRHVLGDEYTVSTPQELLEVITTHHPGFHDLHGRAWSEIREEFSYESERMSNNILPDESYIYAGEKESMQDLFKAFEYFPPDGGDNTFVRELRRHGIASPRPPEYVHREAEAEPPVVAKHVPIWVREQRRNNNTGMFPNHKDHTK